MDALDRVKRQKFESDAYKALCDEYVNLHTRTESGNLPYSLNMINIKRMACLEKQLQSLVQQIQEPSQ